MRNPTRLTGVAIGGAIQQGPAPGVAVKCLKSLSQLAPARLFWELAGLYRFGKVNQLIEIREVEKVAQNVTLGTT
jgi:hypothetical protein